MKKLATLLLAAGLSASSLAAQSNISSQLWDDPTFVKEFLGSYGFLAGAEPPISNEEKESLRNLIDLIKASPNAAIQALEPQITDSSSAAFDFILANLYFQSGNLAKAERYYTNAVVKFPDFRRAYKNLGLVQVQQGNFDKAIKTISKAMELGEVDGRSYGLLGYGYLTQEKYYPAEAAYRQAILMQPDVTDWKVGLARTLLETERYPDAIALFDTLLMEAPDNADYWMLQGNAYLGKGDSMAAAKNLEIVRRMGAADLSTLTLLGDIYMNNNSADLALDAYLAATKVATSSDSKPLLRAASLLTRGGNYEQAKTIIPSIRDQIELAEEEELDLLTLEAKIARAEGDGEAAAELLTQIVERDSLNGDALIELANYYADQGDMAKAINRYEQAEKIEAFEREALVAHAQARVRDGQYKEALPLLRRALQLRSDNNLEDYAQRVERAARTQG
ncbi:MAG: tetratricopeptide repeat protein [Verrucomicrobia bacterium]|jgi:tetratricopeptide (TPR) repeat protein|nr:tetratricopeptide repeat protein [Verrucomicrobiota bacterium]